VPLLMLFGDRDRFRFVGSPLRRIADRYPDDAEAMVWFEKRQEISHSTRSQFFRMVTR
jgi:hypothetical protein